jgi:prevent-host-death family protein
MITAGVRNVKDHFSEYLRRARQGERVVITAHGQPVAALVGLDETEAHTVGWDLVQRGVAEWSGGKPRGLPDAPKVEGRRAEEAVLEDRR